MPIEINALETSRFGITCARRTDTEAALEDVNAAARSQGVRMLTTRVDAGDLPQVHRLEADGYRLMDTLVVYRRRLGPDWQEPGATHGCTLHHAGAADADAVGDVARAAFAGFFGHFHADPRLRPEDADAAYVEWAENSIRQIPGDGASLVAKDDRQVVGFLTLRQVEQARFEVVLNAVLPSHQRSGIYTSLLARGCSLAKDRGGSEVTVSTQINNYVVQKVWGRLGLHLSGAQYTFHKWFD